MSKEHPVVGLIRVSKRPYRIPKYSTDKRKRGKIVLRYCYHLICLKCNYQGGRSSMIKHLKKIHGFNHFEARTACHMENVKRNIEKKMNILGR